MCVQLNLEPWEDILQHYCYDGDFKDHKSSIVKIICMSITYLHLKRYDLSLFSYISVYPVVAYSNHARNINTVDPTH